MMLEVRGKHDSICCNIMIVSWQWYSPGWLNIDCGSNAGYTDPVTGIIWESDEAYITTGKLGSISGFPYFQEAHTLRYFDDSRAKNCYMLPVTKNTTYMLRATFFYNNYDNAAKPPTFKLAIDGTFFDEKFTATADTGIIREVFFKAQSNVTFLCLVRDVVTRTVPFVSAITLKRYLGNNQGFADYFAGNMLIRTEQRQNFGGSGLIRWVHDKVISHDFRYIAHEQFRVWWYLGFLCFLFHMIRWFLMILDSSWEN